MTYQEFKSKNDGKYLDYDKQYRCECWDLAQYYMTQVLNVPDSVLSGCQVVKNMILWDWKYDQLMEYFDEVDVHEMNQGDVCIWTEGWGGHIAIMDNWDGYNCWYFSQDPDLGLPCGVRTIDGLGNPRAFRRKGEKPTPIIIPNVQKDITQNQIEVLDGVTELRIRSTPGVNGEIIGKATSGYYNYFDICERDGYNWYRIGNDNWIASSDEWTKVYPAEEKKEYIKISEYIAKHGFGTIDLEKVYIKE